MVPVREWIELLLECWGALLMYRRTSGKINCLTWCSPTTAPSTNLHPSLLSTFFLVASLAYRWIVSSRLNQKRPLRSRMTSLSRNGKQRWEMRFRLLGNICRLLVKLISDVLMVKHVLRRSVLEIMYWYGTRRKEVPESSDPGGKTKFTLLRRVTTMFRCLWLFLLVVESRRLCIGIC